MVIGVVRIELYLSGCQSLKDKRSITRSLIQRLRNKFNAAIAEVDGHEFWQKGTLGVAVIGGSTAHADSQLQSIVTFIEQQPMVLITDIKTETL